MVGKGVLHSYKPRVTPRGLALASFMSIQMENHTYMYTVTHTHRQILTHSHTLTPLHTHTHHYTHTLTPLHARAHTHKHTHIRTCSHTKVGNDLREKRKKRERVWEGGNRAQN